MRLVEPLDMRLTGLEKQVYEMETKTLTNQLKIESNRRYLDQQLYQMNETLTNVACQMNIVEEITKTWNRIQRELTTINTEIAVVCESQWTLTTLMEDILTRLDMVVETEPPPEEFVDAGAERLARA